MNDQNIDEGKNEEKSEEKDEKNDGKNDEDDDEDFEDDEKDDEEVKFIEDSPFLINIDQADVDIWSSTIKDPTQAWLIDPEWDEELPYSTDEINGTGDSDPDDSLASQLELGAEFLTSPPTGNGRTTVAEMMQIFAYVFDPSLDGLDDCRVLRRVCIRLAHSDPVALFPASSWTKGHLNMNHEAHTAWVAAYHIFGAPWKTDANG